MCTLATLLVTKNVTSTKMHSYAAGCFHTLVGNNINIDGFSCATIHCLKNTWLWKRNIFCLCGLNISLFYLRQFCVKLHIRITHSENSGFILFLLSWDPFKCTQRLQRTGARIIFWNTSIKKYCCPSSPQTMICFLATVTFSTILWTILISLIFYCHTREVQMS